MKAIDAHDVCIIPQQIVYENIGTSIEVELPETTVKSKHTKDLIALGLYPLPSNIQPVLARIVGYLLAYGSVGICEKGPQVHFAFLSEEDCRNFIDDVSSLGFKTKVIITDSEEYGHCEQIIYNNAFASLLVGLVDCFCWKKKHTTINEMDSKWIQSRQKRISFWFSRW